MAPTLSPARQALLARGLAELPAKVRNADGGTHTGEGVAVDDVTVWKRVIAYRTAQWLQPRRILETHVGNGIGTLIYRVACPRAEIVSCTKSPNELFELPAGSFDLVDVDPFGFPYDALRTVGVCRLLARWGVLSVSNGEALLVSRNIQKSLYARTRNIGVRTGRWVEDEYLPRLATLTGVPVRLWYASSATVRAVCSRRSIPAALMVGCPTWFWWLDRHEL